MQLFSTDSLVLRYSNIEAAKQWWIQVFDCKQTDLPDWDDPLPSDIALRLPGDAEPSILLCAAAEVKAAGFERQNSHPILVSASLKKAREVLVARGASPGAIQDSGGKQYFEVLDLEGNIIEVCQE